MNLVQRKLPLGLSQRRMMMVWLPSLMTAGIVAILLSSCGDKASAQGQAPVSEKQAQLPAIPSGFDFVTKQFGYARVMEGDFQSPDTQVIPWSGYWFPKKKTEMFEPDPVTGELSPLQKYDQWVKKVKGVDSHAVDEEAQNYDPDSDSWEGLCNAWAAASIKEPEPVEDAVVDGVHFRAVDLKALLIKTYDGPPTGITQYGQRFEGNYGDDFLDIYPDQFHRFLQVQLFERAEPFVMDKDPHQEVWNVPVYSAETRLMRDPFDSHVMHVTTWITFADFVYDFNYNGGTKPVTLEYTYDLYGIPLQDGSFEVHSGFWTKDSLNDHPDFVTVLPSGTNRTSYNKWVRSDWVDEIVAAAMAGRSTAAE